MDNLSLVSVVIPVYNVEKYLKRCVSSVLNQTYKQLEIILVDDESQDSSGELCDQLEKIDNRIKVIHKENGGLASARNAGIKIASGEYIIFVDSDDWIASDTIEYSFYLFDRYDTQADVVQYGVLETTQEDVYESANKELIQVLVGKDILNFLMEKSTKSDTYFSACRCLYRTSIIKNCLFSEGKINEDISWKYRVLSQTKRMIDSSQIKYFYYQSTGSITTEGLKKKDFDLYDAVNELVALTNDEDYGNIRKLARVKSARTPFSLLCKIAFYGIDDRLDKRCVVKQLQRELRKNEGLLLRAPLPISRKILVVMFSINYFLTEKFIRVAKTILKIS